MADRKQLNKHFPIDWDPSMGSVNKATGYHPLRERAARLATEGVLVVRFETPFPLWCLHCGAHIERAVRFNADKKRVGSFLSTPIWEFSMRCPLCAGDFAIRTDPENDTYVCTSGVKRRETAWTPTASDGLGATSLLAQRDPRVRAVHRARVSSDPIFAAGVGARDAARASSAAERVSALAVAVAASAGNDYELSKRMRAAVRGQRHREERELQRQRERVERTGFALPLPGEVGFVEGEGRVHRHNTSVLTAPGSAGAPISLDDDDDDDDGGAAEEKRMKQEARTALAAARATRVTPLDAGKEYLDPSSPAGSSVSERTSRVWAVTKAPGPVAVAAAGALAAVSTKAEVKPEPVDAPLLSSDAPARSGAAAGRGEKRSFVQLAGAESQSLVPIAVGGTVASLGAIYGDTSEDNSDS